METDRFNVNVINLDGSGEAVSKSKEDLQDGRFTSSSTSNDTNFHSWLNAHRDIFHGWIHSVSIPHGDFIKRDLSLGGPVLLDQFGVSRLNKRVLRLKSSVIHDSLGRGHHVLNLSEHSYGDREEHNNICNDLDRDDQHVFVCALALQENSECAS